VLFFPCTAAGSLSSPVDKYFALTHLLLLVACSGLSCVCIRNFIVLLFSVTLQPSAGYGLLVSRGFLITHNDAPQSAGLLWTSDQLVAETST
jgi:hypothetical protein